MPVTISDKDFSTLMNRIGRIERLLTQDHKPKGWVKVGIVQQLTGWDKAGLKKARENGLVKYKDTGNRELLYQLESIDKIWLKNYQHTANGN